MSPSLRDVLGATVGPVVAGLLTIGGTLIGALGLGPLVELVASTSGLWSPLLITLGRFGGFGPAVGDALLAVGVGGFVLVTGAKLAERFVDWTKNRR